MAPTTSSGVKAQKSILGFFGKKPAGSQQESSSIPSTLNGTASLPIGSPKKKLVPKAPSKVSQTLTPAPSSDAIEPDEDDEDVLPSKSRRAAPGLPSPVTPAGFDGAEETPPSFIPSSTPIRKVSPFGRPSHFRD